MDLFNGVTLLESFFDDENTFIGWRFQGSFHVVQFQSAVFHKAVHALTNHAQTFLNDFFKGATDGHHFTHGFHRTTQFTVYTAEFS